MAKDASKTADASSPSPTSEKPLPAPKRPGTSGTENMLMMNRRQASEQFVKAQRAEKAYRARKQAAAARASYDETKTHFREAFAHLGHGARGLVSVVRAAPYLVCEKKEAWRRKGDAKRRARALEQKKKLEEALARQSDGEAGAGTGEEGAEDGEGEGEGKKEGKSGKADRKKKSAA
ncbi:hypothetical protein F5B20DRAFT_581309 [Whalleya microplaca]|nr:hypothetical protein F5B20DRAFT_581309 [Whalleya microplaca]